MSSSSRGHQSTRRRRSALSTPRMRRPNSTFSRTVRNGNSAKLCQAIGVSRCQVTAFVDRHGH
ncbi:hypothetical protein [Mesorhizobium sp. M0296]|uniref:hypothetical protein n=1 Tax=Mesorhizobium sp. M0296 TaxID=2956931 RepID=UPI003334C601